MLLEGSSTTTTTQGFLVSPCSGKFLYFFPENQEKFWQILDKTANK